MAWTTFVSSSSSKRNLFFVLIHVFLTAKHSLSANECSFVRSYENEQCVYNIHLSQDSNPCLDASSSPSFPSSAASSTLPRNRRHFRRHLDPQNDYSQKIDSMEKTFSFLRDAHEKRLQDLEGTVRGLLRADPFLTSMVQPSVNVSPKKPEARKPSSSSSKNLDDNLLDRLHEEFAFLRKALRDRTEQMFDMQTKVNDTQQKLQKSQVDLFTTNQELLNAENKIALLERERAVLKNHLKDRSYKLEVCSTARLDCQGKLSGQEEQLLGLIRSENTLSEGLMTCQLTGNITKAELRKVERRQRHLKARHSRVKEVLGVREKELLSCYAAKTQTFCGFEDPDLCGFNQPNSTGDFFDWEWGEGSTPSVRTGPTLDHTCRSQKGHFMFIEASAKGRGKNAILYSPLYRGLNPQCIQFYYHMHGRDVGTLNVYAKASGGEELASVWRAWGNQGDLWSAARLSIPKELARAGYQIVFEGITESGYQGDMAIDDVSVKDGQCAEGEGVRSVMVQFNASSIIREGRKFARNIKKFKLSRVPVRLGKKKGGNRSSSSPHGET